MKQQFQNIVNSECLFHQRTGRIRRECEILKPDWWNFFSARYGAGFFEQ